MAIYGFKKYREITAERVNLTAKPTVTNAVGETGNVDFVSTMGLGRKDIGCIIDVTLATMVGTVLAAKPTSITAGHICYMLAELPVPESATDFSFVGIPLETMSDIDNLELDVYRGNWASQFYKLRTGGTR